jgi:hypothetical protein
MKDFLPNNGFPGGIELVGRYPESTRNSIQIVGCLSSLKEAFGSALDY